MQLVVHCVIEQEDKVLMLQKPRRGWWVVPGGKVETGESLHEAVVREIGEETGLVLQDPELRGVFTILVEENGQLVNHWMLFTFAAGSFTGELVSECEEGILEWVPLDEWMKRPMAEGDKRFLPQIREAEGLVTGTFRYTPEYELIEWRPESGI
ncbi:8-oxo-dGTP diphosphatase [Tumebacillus sp. ITR2]|uniref:8-oxo-dGTP diphosphatase n=1 Tax=Tumebacillus amylolyticus TaxID=2801339 RepID=A0ABS1J9D6_9BACL|nr:8-oxo-dGTP diphosphatase [Tumebacillus amylolyticus]MBL0386877.1 8-oxo-dGTP diphosphatase [Tumebacillus amylolyticus]